MKINVKSRLFLSLVGVFISLVFASLSPAFTVRGPVASISTESRFLEKILYVPLAAICRAYGLRLSAVEGDIFVFDSGAIHLEVRAGSDRVLVNDRGADLPGPATWRQGKLLVPLDLARRILPARAVESGADIFVSIHANAAHNHQAEGVETFYYAPPSDTRALRLARLENAADPAADPGEGEKNKDEEGSLPREAWSCALAGRIQKSLAAACRGPNRGVKTAPFIVLKYSRVPAVLVETGFLSNHREGSLLGITPTGSGWPEPSRGGINEYFRARGDGNSQKKVSSK